MAGDQEPATVFVCAGPPVVGTVYGQSLQNTPCTGVAEESSLAERIYLARSSR